MTAILGAFPTYKNVLTGSTLLASHALANALHARGIGWGVTAISNPSIDWVRNWFVTHWYDCMPQFSHILMIDDDMAFMPEVVLDMLAFGEPVVGAIYPKKTVDRQWAVSGIPNPETRGPFLEVEGLGCGCFLIRRDAITTMLKKMPGLIDTRPNSLDSGLFREAGVKRFLRPFDCINDPERGLVSEDISFGRRWRACGGKVWAATHHKMVHVGPHEFADTYSEWAKAKGLERQQEVLKRIEDAPILKENPILKGKPCKHGMMIYNPNDTFIGKSLEWYGEWSEFEIDLLKQFIKEGDTIIDVGANIGTHTVAFSRLAGKEGKVFAFEAQPRLEAILAANIQLNQLGNVYWDNKAIGKENVNILLSDVPPDDVSCNFGSFRLIDNEGKVSKVAKGLYGAIDMITIDSFAADLSPSVIKIDVEGMELDVIRGAKETISRCKPVLYFEYGDRTDGDQVDALLHEIGYVAFWSVGPYFNPMNAFRNQQNAWPQNKVLAANLIAVWAGHEYPGLRGMQPYTGADDTWRKAIERMARAHEAQTMQAAE
jgi:FkbM family methyltransferase